MKKLDVLYTSNNKYLDIMLSSILSLIENGKIEKLIIHIIVSDFDMEDYMRLENILKEKNIEYYLYPLEKYKIEKYEIPNWRGNQVANARLFFQDILKENIDSIEKLLYLDSDTIIVDDLSGLEIYTQYGISAVKDACLKSYYQSFENLTSYYNTGVILIDVKNWLEKDYQSKIIKTIETNNLPIKFPDQDIFNIALHNEIFPLDTCYNAIPYEFIYSDDLMKLYFNSKKRDISFLEAKEAQANPKILHTLGLSGIKPWHENNVNPFNEQFFKYLNIANASFQKEQLSILKKVLTLNPSLFYLLFIGKTYLPENLGKIIQDLSLKSQKCYIKK